MNVRKARRLYNLLLMKYKEGLQNGIKEFQSICDKLDKVKKRSRNMGIAGGATGAVGGAAAVAGIALAPVTMGISLVATAVGAGMVATAGGLGIHAAKASKNAVNRTNVEAMVDDYKAKVVDLEQCLSFILPAMIELRRYNIVKLQNVGAHSEALRMARLSHTVLNNNSRGASLTLPGGGTSASLLKGFVCEMDQYFTEGNGQKIKKSNKSKFSGIVSTLVRNLKEELGYLTQIWELLN